MTSQCLHNILAIVKSTGSLTYCQPFSPGAGGNGSVDTGSVSSFSGEILPFLAAPFLSFKS
jgi:hypothetical protein